MTHVRTKDGTTIACERSGVEFFTAPAAAASGSRS